MSSSVLRAVAVTLLLMSVGALRGSFASNKTAGYDSLTDTAAKRELVTTARRRARLGGCSSERRIVGAKPILGGLHGEYASSA